METPRAVLFWGEDELTKRRAYRELLAELADPGATEPDVEVFDPGSAGFDAREVLEAARERGMFCERRVVTITSAGRLRRAQHQRAQETLAAGIPRLPDYATLILLVEAEGEAYRGGRSPVDAAVVKAVQQVGVVREFAAPRPERLAQMAAELCRMEGKRLVGSASSLLAERVDGSTLLLEQEVLKLCSYAGEREEITPADVRLLTAESPDENVFHLLDAAMSGNRRRTLTLLGGLRATGVAPQEILARMGGHLREVIQARCLVEAGVDPRADAPPEELRAELPEGTPLYGRSNLAWRRERAFQTARRLDWPTIHHAFDRLGWVDAGTKGWEQGYPDADLALELYLGSLCETLSRARRR